MKKLTVALAVGVAAWGLSLLYFDAVQSRLLGIIAFLVVLWSNEGLPLGVVSMMPLLFFPMLGILPFDAVAPSYAKPIIFLFLGGFLLAIGMQKTALHIILAHKILGLFPKTVHGIILALSITSALLSGVLNNTTTTLLLVPIALFLSDQKALQMRFVLAVAFGASIGGISTPIGTAPNLIFLQFLQEHALESVAFFEWIFKVAPLAASMLLVLSWLLALGMDKSPLQTPLYIKTPLTLPQRKMASILALLVVVLFVNSPIRPYYNGLGLNEMMLLLGAGLLLFMPKIAILTWEDTREVPYAIIFLFGASFAIAAAFSSTHLGAALAQPMQLLGDWPWWLLLMAVAFFIGFATEITSNTALVSIALPIVYALSVEAHLDATTLLMVAAIASSYAFMLPIATPPNAIAMSTGVVTVRDMVRYGFILHLFAVVMIGTLGAFFW
ncbi:MAG: anion transporter [Sulfuricurvum sp. PC08-66]|nr:MAG: anion transporter [Sulfuricurvum sp. PC08-66]